MSATTSAQDQIADFLADAIPERILAFKFSSGIQKRIEILVNRKKEGAISGPENAELEHYLLYDNAVS